MSQEWLLLHSPYFPACVGAASLVILALQRISAKDIGVDETTSLEEEPAGAFKWLQKVVQRAGSATIVWWQLARLLGCVALLSMSGATWFLEEQEQHGLAYALAWERRSAFQWSAGTTLLSPRPPSWSKASLIAVYAYSSALSLWAILSRPRASYTIQLHLGLTLLATWLVYFARDIFPLLTYTLVPLDASDRLLWPKVAALSLAGVLIPLCIPHAYIPVDPQSPSERPPPEQTASWLSFLTFSFMTPLVWKGYRAVHLGWDELPPLADADRAEYLRQEAFRDLDPFDPANAARPRRHLFLRLLHVFRAEYVLQALGLVARVLTAFLAPVGLNRLLAYIETGGAGAVVRPGVWIAWLFLGPLLSSIANECYISLTTRVLVRTEAIITQLVFEHALRIRIKEETQPDESARSPSVSGSSAVAGAAQPASAAGGKQHGQNAPVGPAKPRAPRKSNNLVGKINNLVTTDLSNIDESRGVLFLLIYCPLQMAMCIWFLYEVLGAATFAGLATMVVTFPLPGWVAVRVNKITKERAKKTDARVQEATEVMGLLRMIKLLAWEPKIRERLSEKREDELTWIWKTRALALINMNLNFAIPLATMMVAYTTYTLVLGHELSASRVFSSIIVFEMLRNLFQVVGYTVPAVIQAKVSLDRLSDFLHNTELLDRYAAQQAEVDVGICSTMPSPEVVGFQEASFRWAIAQPSDGASTPGSAVAVSSASTGRREFTLRIPSSLQFPLGALSIIVGPTGCGKTSLLLALCGELHFQPQSPASWYNLPREDGVAYVAQEGWVQNETIRDNILFGAPFDEGRYWKVIHQCGLERDLSLFDAGDLTEVGERGLTLSGGQKARVTLARAVYSKAAILLLDDILAALDVHTSRWIVERCLKGDLVRGRTVILATHNIPIVADITAFVVSLSIDGRVLDHGGVADVLLHADSKLIAQVEQANEEDEKEGAIIDAPRPDEQVVKPKASGKLIMAEEIATGRVSWAALAVYFKSLGGPVFWIVYLGCLAASNVIVVLQTWFLGYWAQQYEDIGHGQSKDIPAGRYILGYAALVVLSVGVSSVSFMVFLFGSMRASRTIHNQLIASILGTTLRWLDTVPVSRVITRCTQDMRSIDGQLGAIFAELAGSSFAILSRLLAIVVMSPVFIVPGIAVAMLGWACGQVYMRSQLSVKREMNNARSPVLGHFGAAIAGLTSIRAYGAESAFKAEARRRIDRYTRTARVFYNLNRWIAVRINAIGGLFSAGLAAYLVYGTASPASVTGFSLSLTVTFSQMILWWNRNLNRFEVEGNSLERIQQFIDIEQEPKSTEAGKPPAFWPASGDIRVEHLDAQYSRDGPLVLRDVNFELKSGERVGVVGRTGSGKSSLTLSLLRCILTSGHVYYDGLATDNLNLDALRGNITIIPQQPELLSGTLRQNLDPFDQHDDSTLNDALRAAGLFRLQAESASEGRLGLDSAISTAGGNLSLGQRQIVALARAIARRSKVMILDEATAAVDYATDTAIQESIRRELRDVTLIIVAHRLRTIMDADKIMVLDAGRLVEFDSPEALLKKTGGLLRSLVDESTDRDELIAMAQGARQCEPIKLIISQPM